MSLEGVPSSPFRFFLVRRSRSFNENGLKCFQKWGEKSYGNMCFCNNVRDWLWGVKTANITSLWSYVTIAFQCRKYKQSCCCNNDRKRSSFHYLNFGSATIFYLEDFTLKTLGNQWEQILIKSIALLLSNFQIFFHFPQSIIEHVSW